MYSPKLLMFGSTTSRPPRPVVSPDSVARNSARPRLPPPPSAAVSGTMQQGRRGPRKRARGVWVTTTDVRVRASRSHIKVASVHHVEVYLVGGADPASQCKNELLGMYALLLT